MLEEVWRKGTLLHCWWECKLVQPLWKTVWRYLIKLNIELLYDPATPLLGIYPDKTYLGKTHAPAYSLQHYSQQPRHGNNTNVHRQMIGLGRSVILYIHNGILLSHKKNKINAICSNMVGTETLILSEVSQKEKDKYHMISLNT